MVGNSCDKNRMSQALENGGQNYQVGIGNPGINSQTIQVGNGNRLINSEQKKKSVGNHFETNGNFQKELKVYV